MAEHDDSGESDANLSSAARFFRSHPGLRESAQRAQAFQQWRRAYKELRDGDETYFVRAGTPMEQGGDTLMDADELLLEWARQEIARRDAATPPEASEIMHVYRSKGEA